MYDLHHDLKVTPALAPKAAVTDNTAFVSDILDTAGFDTNEFVGIFGTNADSDVSFTVLVEDGDNSALNDNAAVDDAYLLGVEAMGLNHASDGKAFKIGYKGRKRYLRITITPANNTGNVFLAAVWLQAHARKGPHSTQVT